MREKSGKGARVHFWMPEVYEQRGGIQKYCTFILRALKESGRDSSCEFFILNDSRVYAKGLPAGSFHVFGKYPCLLRIASFAVKTFFRILFAKPKLIIACHPHFCSLAYFYKKLFGVPFWAIAYGTEAWDIKNRAVRRGIRNADRIISISRYTRDILIKKEGVDPGKISILTCPTDMQVFTIKDKPGQLLERFGLRPNQPVMLTVTRLSKAETAGKGHTHIIQILPELRRHFPDIRYIIAGSGDDLPRIKDMVGRLGLEEAVLLPGDVAEEELPLFYNLCDIFVLPSRQEGFGIVFIEALASGKPVLWADLGGAIDAVGGPDAGVVVDPDDFEEMARKLIAFFRKEEPYRRLFNPQALRDSVKERAGFGQFKEAFASCLDNFVSAKQGEGS